MQLFKIKKRNGSIVTFDVEKIELAIKKAIESV
jgi:anaerobic ribonucleoside-triphosphate reductase